MASSELDECNLFVKYLPATVNDDKLSQLFEPFGEIVSAKVMVDHVDGHSLGYGFVRFRTAEQAARAIQFMSGFKIENKKLLCKLSNVHTGVYSNNTEVSTNLYVKPLPLNTTDEGLRRAFEKFGEIAECKVMVDRQTQASRQIGFVRFVEQENATRALEAMNGAHLDEDEKGAPLIVRYAESLTQKAARRARKAARMMRATAPMQQPKAEAPMPPHAAPPPHQQGPSRFYAMPDGYPVYDPYAASPPTMFNPPMFGSPPTAGMHQPHPHGQPRPMVYSSSPNYSYGPQPPFGVGGPGHHPPQMPTGPQGVPAMGPRDDFHAAHLGASPPHPFPGVQPSPFPGYAPAPVMQHMDPHAQHSFEQPDPAQAAVPGAAADGSAEMQGAQGDASLGDAAVPAASSGISIPVAAGGGGGSAPMPIHASTSPGSHQPLLYAASPPTGPPRTISAPISTGIPLSTSPMPYYHISPGYRPYPYYSPEPSSPTPSECNNLFVFHLPGDADDSVLRALFEPFGVIDSVKVIADKATGKSRGYGFVKFVRVEDAKKAVQAMNGFALENKHLKVSFKTPPVASYSNLMSSSFERRVADYALCSSGDEGGLDE